MVCDQAPDSPKNSFLKFSQFTVELGSILKNMMNAFVQIYADPESDLAKEGKGVERESLQRTRKRPEVACPGFLFKKCGPSRHCSQIRCSF